MTKDELKKAQDLDIKIKTYQNNLQTFRFKMDTQVMGNKETFNLGKHIKDWFIMRQENKKECGLHNHFDNDGGCEFIGTLILDDDDMQYLYQYLKEKYERIRKEFNEL